MKIMFGAKEISVSKYEIKVEKRPSSFDWEFAKTAAEAKKKAKRMVKVAMDGKARIYQVQKNGKDKLYMTVGK